MTVRVLWQGVAASSPSNAAIHCPHASLDGGGVCTADFCGDYQTTCAATGAGTAYTDCASQTSSMAAGISGATSGDTLACRAYHLVRAIPARSSRT